ncbi:MAG: 30S ribosomal protein S2 [Alkalispirochaeta sp.]
MAVVTMKNLLESGVHFGHQTKRWDPRMKKFIFAERNGIHIIDLQKTIVAIKDAYEMVRQTVLQGKSILFIGTKKQAQQAIEKEALACGMHYVNNRWLGGMLTNFTTIKKSLMRLKKLEKMEVDGTFESLTKKEVSKLIKEKQRLEKNLGGIKEMKDVPGAIFIIDTHKEAIAVAEARRMGIPIVAVVDTNCDPTGIDYPIPGNDDAIRAITLFTSIISKAVIEADNEIGLEVIENLQDDEDEQELSSASEGREDDAKNTDESSEAKEEEVETVKLAAAVGADAEEDPGYTAEDYSDYEPGDDPELPKDETTPEEAVAKDAGLDEETLYQD